MFTEPGAVRAPKPCVVVAVGLVPLTAPISTPLMFKSPAASATVEVEVAPAIVLAVPLPKPVTAVLPPAFTASTVIFRPSTEFKETAPVVVSKVAVTPVWLLTALTAAET